MNLLLPNAINADGLPPFLGLLAHHTPAHELTIDFQRLGRVSPAGLAALTAFVARRSRDGLLTHAVGLDACSIRNYLIRMNLLHHYGWETIENFQRRDSTGRFVPLEPITHEVENLGSRIAECIAPGGQDFEHPNVDLYDAAWYLITELANNVHQHSGGRGFIAAQTTRHDGFVRIAIADGGQGIPGSLKESGLPWAQELSDEDIIERALEARISSKGRPTNEGVGLTLSARLVQLMGGHILVTSLGGTVIRSHSPSARKDSFEGGARYPGTIVALSIDRSKTHDFAHKLQKAKELESLLPSAAPSARFTQ